MAGLLLALTVIIKGKPCFDNTGKTAFSSPFQHLKKLKYFKFLNGDLTVGDF